MIKAQMKGINPLGYFAASWLFPVDYPKSEITGADSVRAGWDRCVYQTMDCQRFYPCSSQKWNSVRSFKISPGFQESKLWYLQGCAWRIPRGTALERRGLQKSWLILKDHLLQAEESQNGLSQQAGNQAEVAGGLHGGARSSWPNPSSNEVQGQVTREEFRITDHVGMKAKAHLELNLARDGKGD